MVTLVARDTLVVSAKAGADLEEVPRTGQFCDHTIRSEDVFVVGDAALDPRFSSNPVVVEGACGSMPGLP
jgi:GAF domain-containing protein